MSRTASEGLALVKSDKEQVSLIEINMRQTLLQKIKILSIFVRNYGKFYSKKDMKKLNDAKMSNGIRVKIIWLI